MWKTAIVAVLSSVIWMPAVRAGASEAFVCPDVPRRQSKAVGEAGRFFSEGLELSAGEQYLSALERYLCSLRMVPHENTMFNISQIMELLKDRDSGVSLLIAFREANTDNPFDGDIAKIVDAAAMEKAETERRAIEEADRKAEEERRQVELSLALEDVDAAQEYERRLAQWAHRRKVAGITMLSVSAATLGMGIGFQILSLSQKAEAEDATRYDAFLYHEKRMHNAGAAAGVGYVLTSALWIAGGVSIYQSLNPHGRENASRTLSFNAFPGMFFLSGSF